MESCCRGLVTYFSEQCQVDDHFSFILEMTSCWGGLGLDHLGTTSCWCAIVLVPLKNGAMVTTLVIPWSMVTGWSSFVYFFHFQIMKSVRWALSADYFLSLALCTGRWDQCSFGNGGGYRFLQSKSLRRLCSTFHCFLCSLSLERAMNRHMLCSTLWAFDWCLHAHALRNASAFKGIGFAFHTCTTLFNIVSVNSRVPEAVDSLPQRSPVLFPRCCCSPTDVCARCTPSSVLHIRQAMLMPECTLLLGHLRFLGGWFKAVFSYVWRFMRHITEGRVGLLHFKLGVMSDLIHISFCHLVVLKALGFPKFF